MRARLATMNPANDPGGANLSAAPSGAVIRPWPRQWVPALDRSAVRTGLADIAGPAVGITAWGLVTGVALVQGGLPVSAALLMTFIVYAGSAQLATLPLLVGGEPLPIVWVTALLVNLRFVIFAAATRHHATHLTVRQRLLTGYLFGDLPFALFMRRHGAPTHWGHVFGTSGVAWLVWQVASVVGIVLGDALPPEWRIDLAATLALICVLIPMMLAPRTAKGRQHVHVSDRVWSALPTLTGVCVTGGVSVATIIWPMRLGLVPAIAAGVAVAVVLSHWRVGPTEGSAVTA
jgi:predicted branched-subunit amino acid permease